jgi:GntR family transcriptional regulator
MLAAMLVIDALDLQDTDRPRYVHIMDAVRRAIVLGTLRPGDKLPSVRELAATLHLNAKTVLQAYQELERRGIVRAQGAFGTVVAEAVRPDAQRRAVLRRVVRRAVADAYRHGLDPLEVADAMHQLAADDPRRRRSPRRTRS